MIKNRLIAVAITVLVSATSVLGADHLAALAQPGDVSDAPPFEDHSDDSGNEFADQIADVIPDDTTPQLEEKEISVQLEDSLDEGVALPTGPAGQSSEQGEEEKSTLEAVDGGFQTKIVGGSNQAIEAAPWQVALIDARSGSDFEGQFCGGSIINAFWILTAAHCLENASVSNLRVGVGSSLIGNGLSDLTVDRIVSHPGYNPFSFGNDIALVKLSAPLTFSSSVSPIAIAEKKPKARSQARITGWGSTWINNGAGSAFNYYGTPVWPDYLQGATVQVLADNSCRRSFSNYDRRSMLCAGTSGFWIDTCQGDSGGPLVVSVRGANTLAGVTSFGSGCAWNTPGVYANVANYTQWIKTTAFGFDSTSVPMISGSAVVGQTLTANVSTWSPAASFSYQWLLNGKPIKRATGSTYVVGSKNVGRVISVRVTGSAPSYLPTTVTSQQTVPV